MEHFTWELVMARPEILVPPLFVYCLFFWLLPMAACWDTSGRRPTEYQMPYWQAVRQVSAIFHIATVLAVIILWLLWPYLVIS